ncbi:MAG: ATP-dependent protease [Opitutae bacterium]|nr:ATP-dependent protease [Opitutae bacterium]HAE10385.1 ATP-dependent protease [Opitutae bacterium]|tara:strand:+ start:3454 stop:5079 length:1626 start_codon:yes stop_codon:yes gene_type:complete
MSKKDDDDNNLDDLHKQLRDLLNNKNVQVAFAPFMESMKAGVEEDEDPSEGDGGEFGDSSQEPSPESRLESIRGFDRRPKEIRDYLDRFVIKQEQAKRVLSVAVCDHYNHVRRCLKDEKLARAEYVKPNVLLLGPTGVGKTYLMRTVAKLIGVPFVKADATKFSETGYVGYDVDDLVRDLVKAADGDVELAEFGIIYVDEIDKIASESSSSGRDVSGRGVQINLLKLMEETEVNLHSPQDMMGQMKAFMEMQKGRKPGKSTISTRNILFIVSGAFDQLAENVRKRLDVHRIGFSSPEDQEADESSTSRFLSRAETTDFIKYGFEPEFIGRLPVRVACEELNKDDLSQILRSSEGNVLEQYENDFAGYDIKFAIDDEAIDRIAEEASREKTGARGLVTVLERTFRDFKFELPSSGVRSFEVDSRVVEEPEEALVRILEENKDQLDESMLGDVDRYSDDFKREHGFALKMRKAAKVALVKMALKENRSVRAVCERKFRDFEHGLGIISQRTGKKDFVIDKKVVDDPDKELSRWVVESFENKDS